MSSAEKQLALTLQHTRTVHRVSQILLYFDIRARILKHLLEAEKSTFRKELSFQRSEGTTGFVQAIVFVC
jgi:hypothetical protein